jgi:hypothetical protein
MPKLLTKSRSIDTIRAELDQVKETLRATTIKRAQREVNNPDLFFQPDEEQKLLKEKIYDLRGELNKLSRELASAEGTYLGLACTSLIPKDHKYCKREFENGGLWLKCACQCHQQEETKGKQNEKNK